MKERGWIAACVSVVLFALLLFGYEATSPNQHASHTSSHQHGAKENQGVHRREQSHQAGLSPTSKPQFISPIPQTIAFDRQQAKIGWQLFNDANLSSNRMVSCETCHDLATNGAETIDVSIGVHGKGIRNSLTIFNSAYNYRFFWDGRVNTLHDQIDGPVHSSVEMDTDWPTIERYVSENSHYQTQFEQANLAISEATIKQVLVEFMRTLNTPNAPFDRYIQGDSKALTAQQIRGWEAFQSEGCISCHRGINVGGGMVMRFGFLGEQTIGAERSNDTGRHRSTGKNEDMYLFRVASLRNVADTAPYFHDGQTKTLQEAIKIMGESQLGKTLAPHTITDIEAFLISLSGERPSILQEFENE